MIKAKASSWMDVKGVLNAVKQAQVKPMFQAGLLVERDAKESLSIGAGRKIYVTGYTRKSGEKGKKRRRKKIIFEPSKAPDPPHVRTGNLRASIATAPTKHDSVVVGPMSPPAPYGQHLEFGTRNMAARPFMRPALMRTRKKFAGLWKNLKLAMTKDGRRLNRRKK